MYDRWGIDDMTATPDSGALASKKADLSSGNASQPHTPPTKIRPHRRPPTVRRAIKSSRSATPVSWDAGAVVEKRCDRAICSSPDF